ncbi:MAG: transcription elongation factor subunit Spt4 [Candidatus Hodarchaeota archaeon]
MKEKACRTCHRITESSHCPKCKTSNLSENFVGVVVIVNPTNSLIASKLNVNEPGKYALKVR